MSYNALAMSKGEYYSIHSVYTLPKVAYLQQASEGHQQWTADHADQLADHYQGPEISSCSALEYRMTVLLATTRM